MTDLQILKENMQYLWNEIKKQQETNARQDREAELLRDDHERKLAKIAEKEVLIGRLERNLELIESNRRILEGDNSRRTVVELFPEPDPSTRIHVDRRTGEVYRL